jgi:transketolase
MAIIAPCDPAETRAATLWCTEQTRGPVYLRLGKAGEPDLTAKALSPFEFGKLRYLQRGRDVCIIGYGPILKLGTDLAKKFEAAGRSVSVVSCHTVKPLDVGGLKEVLKQHRHVIVIEETSPQGGLAPHVKTAAWDMHADCRIDTFALQDAFIHNYGKHEELQAAHGLDLKTMSSHLGLS